MLNSAIINLSKIQQNAKKIRAMLPKNVKFCAVVKADAYGHGASMVANAIYNIVDCFAVAITEEGVSLRYSGIDKDILVLTETQTADIEKCLCHDLIMTVSSFNLLVKIEKVAKNKNIKARIHIAYNTGMNRLGIDSLEELDKIMKRAVKCKYINIEGLYSHYSNPSNNKSLNSATNKFLLANNLVKGYNNKIISHISASGGFLQKKYFNMVRIGILLYGYTPYKTNQIKVSPAMKVYAPIIKKRLLNKNQTLLYGDKKVHKKANFFLVRYGYADGLNRKPIKNQFNNRCMDISAINGNINKKRKFCIMENAEILAQKYHTISYEILVKAPIRAERKYIL